MLDWLKKFFLGEKKEENQAEQPQASADWQEKSSDEGQNQENNEFNETRESN